jgi:hypothetical protein
MPELSETELTRLRAAVGGNPPAQKRKEASEPEGPAPLCACNCRRPVKWNKYTRRWNAYLVGHNGRNSRKSPAAPTKSAPMAELPSTVERNLAVLGMYAFLIAATAEAQHIALAANATDEDADAAVVNFLVSHGVSVYSRSGHISVG